MYFICCRNTRLTDISLVDICDLLSHKSCSLRVLLLGSYANKPIDYERNYILQLAKAVTPQRKVQFRSYEDAISQSMLDLGYFLEPRYDSPRFQKTFVWNNEYLNTFNDNIALLFLRVSTYLQYHNNIFHLDIHDSFPASEVHLFSDFLISVSSHPFLSITAGGNLLQACPVQDLSTIILNSRIILDVKCMRIELKIEDIKNENIKKSKIAKQSIKSINKSFPVKLHLSEFTEHFSYPSYLIKVDSSPKLKKSASNNSLSLTPKSLHSDSSNTSFNTPKKSKTVVNLVSNFSVLSPRRLPLKLISSGCINEPPVIKTLKKNLTVKPLFKVPNSIAKLSNLRADLGCLSSNKTELVVKQKTPPILAIPDSIKKLNEIKSDSRF